MIKNKFIRYWLPVCLLCAGIFLESSFAIPDFGQDWSFWDGIHADKIAHAIMFGMLSFLICRAFNSLTVWRKKRTALVIIGVLLATLYGLSDEVHQSFVVVRTADPADLMADFFGAVLGALLFIRLFSKRPFRPSQPLP